jgi:hypothetical protein
MAFGDDSIAIVTSGYRRSTGGFEDLIVTFGYFGNILGTGAAVKIYHWLKKKLLR